MTIAACYLSSEGVVFGADSTSTMYVSGLGPGSPGSEHHFNWVRHKRFDSAIEEGGLLNV